MFIYQNDFRGPNLMSEIKENLQPSTKFITILINEKIQVRSPLKLACSLSKKISKTFVKESIEGAKPYIDNSTNVSKADGNNIFNIYIKDLFKHVTQKKHEKGNDYSSNNDFYQKELKKQIDFYEKQLTLLFNGYDIVVSHQYINKFKNICKNFGINSFLEQLENDYLPPELHETQHEMDILREIENFFFSLTDENIHKMLPQILSLFYQTQPEFFCLILINQCLIQSKWIEVFVYLFEEILNMIDNFNNIKESKVAGGERCKESQSLIMMLENILIKSLKLNSTYGIYKPGNDLAHEMFPQEYFYLCQLLYSRGLINLSIFQESFKFANWQDMSYFSQNKFVQPKSQDCDKIFITEYQYITIQDFYQDFTDENCRYKHKSKEQVEEMIKKDKSKYIHMIDDDGEKKEYVNWISLYLEGESPDLVSKALRNDDIKTFQLIVNTKYNNLEEFAQKYGSIRRSIYERKSIINKDVKPIEYAAFFGSEKCFKYLIMNECVLDLAAKYAVAGSHSEIIHICHQKEASFKDTLLLSIRYHRWEITEWLLETLNVYFYPLSVVKLCVNCGNFNSLFFIVENLLSKKLAANEFMDEMIIVQLMFYLKYEYGFLMTCYKDASPINLDDKSAIFWHEPFFSYIFDKILPREIEDEEAKTENEANENEENKEAKTGNETNENEENKEAKTENEANKNEENKESNTENETNENEENKESKNENKKQENEENGNGTNKNESEGNENEAKNESEGNENENRLNDTDKSESVDRKGKNDSDANESIERSRSDKEARPSVDYEEFAEDEINYFLRKERSHFFYDIPAEMVGLIYILQNSFVHINNIPYRLISPLQLAIIEKDNKLFDLLMMHTKIDLNYTSYEHPFPLFYSIKARNAYAFKKLIENPKTSWHHPTSVVNFIVQQYEPNKENDPINESLLSIFWLYLKSDRFNKERKQPIEAASVFIAFEKNEYRLLEEFVKSGMIDLNVFDDKGNTLLHRAIIGGDEKVFELLLSANKKGGRKAVDLNLQTKNKLTIRSRLVEKSDKTPVMLALESKNENFLYKLLDEDDVDVSIRDQNGNTLLNLVEKSKIKNADEISEKINEKIKISKVGGK